MISLANAFAIIINSLIKSPMKYSDYLKKADSETQKYAHTKRIGMYSEYIKLRRTCPSAIAYKQ